MAPSMSKKTMRQTPNQLPKTARKLEEAKQLLEDVEAMALSGVVLVLTEAAKQLSRTAKDLADMQPTEWMTPEQAAKYLGYESPKAFEKIAAREGVPKHYLSARTPRSNSARRAVSPLPLTGPTASQIRHRDA